MSFDYGVPEDYFTTSDLKVWDKEGEFTALVDADLIPYIVGYSLDPLMYLQAQRSGDFFNHKHWKTVKASANSLLNKWVREAECDSAMLFMTYSESDICNREREDHSDYINFRYGVAVTRPYKEDRTDKPKPPFFYELRDWLITEHGVKMSKGNEADDEISIEAWKRILKFEGDIWSDDHKMFSDFCIISKDKDLNIIPTWHYDLVEGEKYWVDPFGILTPIYRDRLVNKYEYRPLFNGKPIPLSHCAYIDNVDGELRPRPAMQHPEFNSLDHHWSKDVIWYYSEKGMPELQDTYIRGKNVGKGKYKRAVVGKHSVEVIDKLKGTGLMFFYSQIITGDSADCYGGLAGAGNATAYEALRDCTSEKELFDTVLDLYRKKHRHRAETVMTEMGQLAWMQTYEGERWKLLDEQREASFQK